MKVLFQTGCQQFHLLDNFLKVGSVEEFLEVEGFNLERWHLPGGADLVAYNITKCGKQEHEN